MVFQNDPSIRDTQRLDFFCSCIGLLLWSYWSFLLKIDFSPNDPLGVLLKFRWGSSVELLEYFWSKVMREFLL